MSFLDIQIICKGKTFTTSVYRKPTFDGAYTHFDSFLQSSYKFGTVCTLTHGYLQIYSSWTKLHNEQICLKAMFLKDGCPEDVINKCFKNFMDNIHVANDTTLMGEKKPHVLFLPYLGSISFKLGLSWRSD